MAGSRMKMTVKRGGALAAMVLAATGCQQAVTAHPAGGSLGLHSESGTLFAADLDNDGVAVVDSASGELLEFVKTGARPERVLVAGDRVYVANRLGRTVTVLDAKTHAVLRQIAVGAEPMGLGLSKGGDLIVTNAMSGTVEAINTNTGAKLWETTVGEETRAVAALPDGRLYVPGFKSGTMHVLDGSSGAQLSTFSFAQEKNVELDFDRQPTGVHDIVVSDDGRVYLPHQQSNSVALPPIRAGYYAVGPAPSTAPGVTTLALTGDTLFKEAPAASIYDGPDSSLDFPPTVFQPNQPFAGPRAAAIDENGDWLYVVNQFSNNVAVISTRRRTVRTDSSGSFGVDLGTQGVVDLVPVGRGPSGIALSPNATELFVYNAFDHSISVVVSTTGNHLVVNREFSDLTPQTLSAERQRGRLLFNDAQDSRVSLVEAGGVACASCHPDGREDGHDWKFFEGTRNTPSLVGKGLKQTKPYHWDGQLTDFAAFEHVVTRRMGGSGLGKGEFDAILEFLDGEPGPDNPNRAADGELTAIQARGRDLFTGQAKCATCHAGEILTDNKTHDVGTSLRTIDIDLDGTSAVSFTDPTPADANTPSLEGIFATAPYMHDGQDRTLEARLRNNPGDKHGITSDLSDAQIKELVAYISTL